MSTEIIVTNGVDFTLVDGACCCLYLANNSGNSRNPIQFTTLNINSTGAKSIATTSANDTGYTGNISYLYSKYSIIAYGNNVYSGFFYITRYPDYSDA